MMLCPKCQSYNVMVIESRSKADTVRRRRKCLDCDHRFSTIEVTMEQCKQVQVADKLIRQLVPLMDKIREIISHD